MQLAKNAAFPTADFYYEHISRNSASCTRTQGEHAQAPQKFFVFVFPEVGSQSFGF